MIEKNVLLSLKNLEIKFRVRGRTLTAIRGISLDIYENESIAIVGESGSGKSVLTKSFAGMLDSNGYVSNGEIILKDDALADTDVVKTSMVLKQINRIHKRLNQYSKYELASRTYKEILALEAENNSKRDLSNDELNKFDTIILNLENQIIEKYNLKQASDTRKEKDKIREINNEIALIKSKIKDIEDEKLMLIKKHKDEYFKDKENQKLYKLKIDELNKKYNKELEGTITDEIVTRNLKISKEICLSIGRYSLVKKTKYELMLLKELKKAMKLGLDLDNPIVLNSIFEKIVFRVEFVKEDEKILHGICNLDLAKIKYTKDWQQIRGARIATVFQDPMTSLNPIVTIGNQITSIILKHQGCSISEARQRAIELMKKVGIPNAENRFDDYPFQYSGGMRQRIVIAIALSCQPKILICDEPTTALDVTIQAQILKLIKDLQKEFKYTIIFITHDLGVVANIADRVAVLYAGQIVELGTCEEIFYDPRHPYTWALLSSLPQLATKGEKLYSISGTPPSLYSNIVGDPFASRNPYCLKIDTLMDSPMFKITDTHYAKTWLLDPRAPKIEKPEIIQNIHEKLVKAFNI